MLSFGTKFYKSILFRILITFFVILIPLYILGINIYSWGKTTLKDQIINSIHSQVTNYMTNFEQEITRIRTLELDFLNNNDLNMLANASSTMDKIEMTETIWRLQRQLFAIKNSSKYIQDVSVHIRTINRTISVMDGVEDFNTKKFKAFNSKITADDAIFTFWENGYYMVAAFPFRGEVGNYEPLYVVEVDLSNKELRNVVQQFDIFQGGAFLINNLNGHLLISDISNAEIKSAQDSLKFSLKNFNGSGVLPYKIDRKELLFIYSCSKSLGMSMVVIVPIEQVLDYLEKYETWFWIFTVVSAIIIILFSHIAYKSIYRPLVTLIGSFNKVKKGDLNAAIQYKHNDEFLVLYNKFNEMIHELSTLIEQVYKQKIMIQRAELKQLQAQINPHFLYNSFFMLNRMIESEDYENSSHFSYQLGNYFQFITRNATDEVPLIKEVEHAKTYTEIQRMRFSNRMKLIFEDLPEQYHSIPVPRLILQPIIENAIEHGLKNRMADGILSIRFTHYDSDLCIIVEDNGNQVSDPDINDINSLINNENYEMECTGIVNIHRRIQLKYGHGSGISVLRGELGGLKVIITMKLNKEGKEYVSNTFG